MCVHSTCVLLVCWCVCVFCFSKAAAQRMEEGKGCPCIGTRIIWQCCIYLCKFLIKSHTSDWILTTARSTGYAVWLLLAVEVSEADVCTCSCGWKRRKGFALLKTLHPVSQLYYHLSGCMMTNMTIIAFFGLYHDSCLHICFVVYNNLQTARQYRLENELCGKSFFTPSIAVII